jgi:3-oxoadipate enol-lactonase
MQHGLANRHVTLRSGDQALFLQDAGEGEPVLMLSGLGYASWCWEDLMSHLRRELRVIALDNRGTGRSAKPAGPYSIEMFADDAAAALDGLGVASAHVIGNSMGGYIAMMLAVRHPHRVRSLLLTNTARGGADVIPIPEETAAAWRDAAMLTPREFVRRTMAYSYPPGWADAHRERIDELVERRLEFPTPQECWREQYAACERYLAEPFDVSRIEARALVVHGKQDRVLPYGNGVTLARELKRGTLLALEEVGHLPFLQDPAAFARIARDFVATSEGRP